MADAPAPPQAPARPPRALTALKVGLPLAALLLLGAWWLHRDQVSTDDAQVDGHLVPVAARIAGAVEEVRVQDNQQVKAGEVLVELDPRDLKVKVAQAKAGVLQAEAQRAAAAADLERARAAHAQAQGPDEAQARAAADARRAAHDKARADVARMQPLAERQEISGQAWDGYRTAAEVAEGEWRAAEKRLASLRDEAGVRKVSVGAQAARLASAEAQVAQARAALEALDLQLSYTRVTAAVDGAVTRKLVQKGQIVQPGQALMTLVPLHQTWVTANFKETQLARMRPGQAAEVLLDINGAKVKGRVDSIAGSTGSRMSLLPPENAVGNFVKVVQRIPVKIRLEDREAAKVDLRPGMNVEATVFLK